MELDGLFLDMYGTLTAGDRNAVEGVCEDIVRDAGVSISPYELSVTWGERFFNFLDFCNGDEFMNLFDVELKTLRETMEGLGEEIDPHPYCYKLQLYWRDPPLHDDTKLFLDTCRYPVCIVSNADQVDAEAVVAKHSLEIDHVITSEAARSYKPDRGIFETALAKTGWRRERVLHVGDSLHSDIGGAIVTGIRNVWLNRAHRIHDIGTHEPDHEIEDLHGLATLLRTL